jgi:light-regulated signal transduction histidine kinase (bacteriophytochrome)
MNAERTCAASLAPLAVEVMTDTLAGAHRWLQVHAVPKILSKGEVQWDGVVTDITDTRHAEDRLKKQAAGLQDLNRELGAYAEAVAHNLLGPLQVIDRTLQLIREGPAATVKEQMSECLSEMEAASEWMRSIITDMQHMALISESLVTRQRVDLSEIAREVMTTLTSEEPEREVDVRIAPDAVALGDSGLLLVGMRALLEQAWNCTREIAYARIEFGFTNLDGKRVFHLKHDGAGFDLGKVSRLGGWEHFAERFPRMDTSLALIRRIIEQHGGRLWTEHKQHAGTTVHFTI